MQSGDVQTAVTDYTQAIDSRDLPPDVLANALLNRGLAYQRLNEHEFAIDDYTAALRIDALSGKVRALALYNRGLSYQRLERAMRWPWRTTPRRCSSMPSSATPITAAARCCAIRGSISSRWPTSTRR